MNKQIKKVVSVCSLAMAMACGSAHGATLTFDDITGSTGGLPMPDGYGGFSWGGAWHVMQTTQAPSNNFLALNGSNGSFILSNGGTDFFFDGAEFWSRRGVDANGRFYYQLWNDNVMVYDGFGDNVRMDFSATPTLLAPDYTGAIDMIVLAFDVTGEGGDWDHLAMDNFQYRPTVVPVPAAGLLMLSGLTVFAAGLRRKVKRV